MRNIWVVIFAVAFLFRPAIPVIEYLIHYDYIVAERCINKDMVNSDCHGKCHLANELADASQNDNSSLPQKPHFKIDLLFFVESSADQISRLISYALAVHYGQSDLYCYLTARTIFHPPAAA